MLRCASCGAKNKANFEFCVRCSDPLADAKESSPRRATTDSGDGVRSVGGPISRATLGLVAAVVVAVAIGGVTWLGSQGDVPAAGNPIRSPSTPVTTAGSLTSPPLTPDVNMGEASSVVRDALVALREGRLDEALPLFERAARELPNNPSIHVYLGNVLYDSGELDRAIESMETAYELDGASEQIRDNLVTLYKAKGEPERAVAMLEDAISDYPDDEFSKLELLRLARDQGDHDRAVELSADLSREDEGLEVTFERGESLRRAGNLPGALDAFRQAASDNPDSAQAHFAVGVTELQLGNPSEAISALKSAVQHEPDNADYYFRLAEAYENSKQFEQSFAEYENYLRRAPASDPRAEQIREQLDTAKEVWAERKKQSQNQ